MALTKIIFTPTAVALVSCVTTFLFNLCVHAKTYFVLFRGWSGQGFKLSRTPKSTFHINNNKHNSDSLLTHRVHPATPQHSPKMLLSVLTVTRPTPISPPATGPNSPREQATGRMQGTNESQAVLTGGTGGGKGKWGIKSESKLKGRERDKRQIFVFKYIKMDTVGSYIHIHQTKGGGRRAI